MFPEACAMEVRHCLAVSNGDLGLAAQIVLHRQEAGQSINGNSAPSQVIKIISIFLLQLFITNLYSRPQKKS